MKTEVRRVAIVGGGFGGLNAAKKLGNQKNISVTLIDRRNYHLFQPLLYQVATAGLSPAEIAVPIRSLLSKYKNIDVLMENVVSISLKEKKIFFAQGSFDYDYLLLSCGANHSYFGHPEWEEFAPGLKTLEQSTEIRRRILLAFEKADAEKDAELKKQHLTFVVIGGGPTGVELAGTLGEITRHTLKKDFRHIDPKRTRIFLIEAGPRILSSFSEKLSAKALSDLESLGVQVWTESRVTQITESSVAIGAEKLNASTVLWAAGVKPSSLNKQLRESDGIELDSIGRIIVGQDTSIPGFSNVFVIGDQAHFIHRGAPLPGLAPVAIQQGKYVAKLIQRELANKSRTNFIYADKGQMAAIGRKKAIVQIKNLEFSGFFAWIAWLFIHIYYLIGFKNKAFVLFQWAWSYLTFRRGARLIVNKEWKSSSAD